ncbi:MAG TPA: NAD(P)H-binding protein [Thermoanaerobaculia bacterium]|nr:NAD(P)H-binding protein [Thermoanaerobaculia bacterium]
MPFHPTRIAIVGATGPTGYHLARELLGRGREVRVVSRRREHLERLFAGHPVEIVPADALDPQALGGAIAGCGLVVDAIGLPPERMEDHPRVARHVADAAAGAGARCLQISSFWSFLPHRGEVVDEGHPRAGGHRWFRLRREAEDVLLAAGAAVVHLPDFFGPHVHTSSVQNALVEALAGQPMNCLGSPDVEREVAYVPDAMRTVADLAERDEAYGTDWGIPGNGTPSPRELARLAGDRLGREVKIRSVPLWLIRLLAPVVPALRPAVPLAPHYAKPVRYDTAKLRGLLGEQERTPLAEAVGATLDWLPAPGRGGDPPG